MNEKIPAHLEEALDQLFAAGPGEQAVLRATANLRERLSPAGARTLLYDRIPGTPLGTVFVARNERGVIDIDFGVPEETFLTRVEQEHGSRPIREPQTLHEITTQLSDYLTNKQSKLNILFDISNLTPFQQQVLRAALQIPRGQVATYGQVAERIGNPKAVRAVGQALGRNPVPILIPCHRVVASNGKLGGYSGGGGVEAKRKLLVLEGALMG